MNISVANQSYFTKGMNQRISLKYILYICLTIVRKITEENLTTVFFFCTFNELLKTLCKEFDVNFVFFCLFIAMNEMQRGTTPICIDNTNITKAEMKPYVELVYSNLYFDFS